MRHPETPRTGYAYLRPLCAILLSVTLVACGGGGGDTPAAGASGGSSTPGGSDSGAPGGDTEEPVDEEPVDDPEPEPEPPADQTPIASPDSATTTSDTPVDIDVLANDNVGDAPVVVTLSGAPAAGSATLLADNRVRYTPQSGSSGTFDFGYRLTDADGDMALSSVSVTVTCVDCDSPSNARVVLEWSPNADAVHGYRVYFGADAGSADNPVGDLSITDGDVDPAAPSVVLSAADDLGASGGDTVCFSISAYNGVGESDRSAAICNVL